MTDATFDMIVETFRKFLRRGAITHLSNMANKMRPADLAQVIRHLGAVQERRTVFELLRDVKARAAVVSESEPGVIGELLLDMPPHDVVVVLRELASDDVADILGNLPEEKAQEILHMMKADESSEVKDLLQYPEETAGGIMTTDFVSLYEDTTVKDAIAHLQETSAKQMVFYLYVTDRAGRLVGVVSLRQLLVVSPITPLKKIMTTDVISVATDVDQEEVSKLVAKYNILAIPVVDKDHVLVGIITVDDVVDVIREEATEDILKLAGATDADVLQLSSIRAARIRMPWLLTSLVGGMITGVFLWIFRPAIQHVIALASFIPVITAMGGNVGLQTSTLVVRGLATGRIESAEIRAVFFKELSVGLMLGSLCGLIVGAVAQLWHGPAMLGVVVGVSMFSAITVASLMGTLMPILLRRAGFDPAISSGPFVTAANDITGLVIYLGLATVLLEHLLV
ncbi:MAG: magnesium transporter [Nitrospirota bacterium]